MTDCLKALITSTSFSRHSLPVNGVFFFYLFLFLYTGREYFPRYFSMFVSFVCFISMEKPIASKGNKRVNRWWLLRNLLYRLCLYYAFAMSGGHFIVIGSKMSWRFWWEISVSFSVTTGKLNFHPPQFCEPEEISIHKQNKIKNKKDLGSWPFRLICWTWFNFISLFTRV